MTAYYNEWDKNAAAWLRELIKRGLIADGVVDERSINDVKADELREFTQVHLFAGIGGWSLALRLAGWDDDRPVWTGSCPCQPFSSAGNRKGHADDRHLWPEMFRLVRECRPATVLGEQVGAAVRHGWLDGVFTDLEAADYACGAVIVGAHSAGAPHIRQRIYWVAQSGCQRDERWGIAGNISGAASGVEGQAWERQRGGDANSDCESAGRLVNANDGGRRPQSDDGEQASGTDWAGAACGLELADLDRRSGQRASDGRAPESAGTGGAGPWSDFTIIPCLDGKSRRVGRGVFPLVNGIPRDMGRGQPELFRLARRARANRKGRLKGYGNAIVPALAAEFIKAYMDI